MTLAAAGLPTPGIISNHSPLASLNHLNRSQQSFKYDHLRKEASDYKPWSADSEVLEGFLETWPIIENKCFHIWYWCIKVEGLRAAIEAEVTAYALNHYRHGVSATFSKPTERYHYCIKIHVKSWFPVKNTSAREMKIGHILLLSVFLLVPVFYSYLSFYLQ